MHALLLLMTPVLLAAEPQAPIARQPFLQLCDAMIPLLDDKDRRVPFYQDSYAVRALAVAYDMTGKRQYLDVCRRWSTRMLDDQSRMIPHGAYYMNYGRKPGESKGDWYVGDSSSIGLAVLATALRCPDAREKARFLDSVTTYARLVMDHDVLPCGGISDGLWSRFDGEWWCSTGIFGSLAFVLHDQTGDPAYLKVGLRAVDWMNRQRFENAQHINYEEAAPAVLMYVFELIRRASATSSAIRSVGRPRSPNSSEPRPGWPPISRPATPSRPGSTRASGAASWAVCRCTCTYGRDFCRKGPPWPRPPTRIWPTWPRRWQATAPNSINWRRLP